MSDLEKKGDIETGGLHFQVFEVRTVYLKKIIFSFHSWKCRLIGKGGHISKFPIDEFHSGDPFVINTNDDGIRITEKGSDTFFILKNGYEVFALSLKNRGEKE